MGWAAAQWLYLVLAQSQPSGSLQGSDRTKGWAA